MIMVDAMAKTPEEKSAYYKEYYAKNREVLLQKQRERSKRNYAEKPDVYAKRTKAWREENKERMAELSRMNYEKNKERIREYSKAYYLANKSAALSQSRARKLKMYGMTEDCYAEMAASQNHSCLICGIHQLSASKAMKLYVDHCHSTGIVRGLLCQKCNAGLGMFKDNPLLLQKAMEYLSRSSSGAT